MIQRENYFLLGQVTKIGRIQLLSKTILGNLRNHQGLGLLSEALKVFHYLTKAIKEQELYRWHDFNRSAVMQHFSLSAARVGAAFAQGGGQSLPEYVRKCRLDHACRLMVEQPTMSFVEVGDASGYQRTTTFYHDFKARFGMAPAEYRKMKNEELKYGRYGS